jgi:hypothetical protein
MGDDYDSKLRELRDRWSEAGRAEDDAKADLERAKTAACAEIARLEYPWSIARNEDAGTAFIERQRDYEPQRIVLGPLQH